MEQSKASRMNTALQIIQHMNAGMTVDEAFINPQFASW
jgi:hypothetical protein